MLIREALESDVENEIKERWSQPEYSSVAAFVKDKVDNISEDVLYDESLKKIVVNYDFIDLQVLSRKKIVADAPPGKYAKELPHASSKAINDAIHMEIYESLDELQQLEGADKRIDFVYVNRAPSKQTRGFTSNPHGRHPFAGSGGGGSGFGDSGFTSHGGGPGAIGSGKAWSPNSAGSLRMGAGRK